MMEILIGLVVATIASIGWFYGNVFFCVFLTLLALFPGALGVLDARHGGPYSAWLVIISFVLLIVIWTPLVLRRRRAKAAATG